MSYHDALKQTKVASGATGKQMTNASVEVPNEASRQHRRTVDCGAEVCGNVDRFPFIYRDAMRIWSSPRVIARTTALHSVRVAGRRAH